MFDAQHKRYLQSILDAVSASTNLPIRLLSIRQLDRLAPEDLHLSEDYENLDSCYEQIASAMSRELQIEDPDTSTFPSLATLAQKSEHGEISSEVYNDAINKIAQLENRLYKGTTAHLHTFSDLLRLSPEWRWYELLWLYKNRNCFRDTVNQTLSVKNVYNLPGWIFICRKLDLESGKDQNAQYMLLAGPINTLSQEENREVYFEERNRQLYDIYERFNNTFCRQSVTMKFSLEEVDRVLRLRVPVTYESIIPRVRLAERVVTIVSKNCSSLIKDVDDESHANTATLRFAADLALASGRVAQSHFFYDHIYRIWQNNYSKSEAYKNNIPLEVGFDFSIPLNSNGHGTISIGVAMRKDPSDSGIDWRYNGRFTIRPGFSQKALQSIEVNGESITDKELVKSINQKLVRWSETSYTRRKSFLGNRSNLIGSWLSHNFLRTRNVLENSVNTTQTPERDEVYNILSQFIAESTRTEACQIYRYYSHEGTGVMKVLGRSARGDAWNSSDSMLITNHMGEFAFSNRSRETKIKESIVYRAAAEQKLVYRELPSEDFDPSDRGIAWPKRVTRPRAIAAAPILIEGRIWGVIEIATAYVGAIENTTLYSLSDFTGVLGVYFFSITYNQNIRSLSLWDGSEYTLAAQDVNKISNQFAERICRITMGQAAILLLQKPGEGGCVYDITGFSGIEKDDLLEQDELELDLLSDKGMRFLAGRLWSKYVEKSLTFIGAKVDPDAQEPERDNEENILLGKNYFRSLDKGPLLSNLVNPSVKQIMAFTFDVVNDLGLSTGTKAFGIDLDIFKHSDPGPTGMVLVYFDHFIDRPHWHGVNADIAIRLANCYKDIIVDRTRQSTRGALIRHEVKQTVFAIAGAATEIRRTANFVRHSISQLKRMDELPSNAKEKLTDISDSSVRLGKLTGNIDSAYELLATQIQNIERADYADLNVFSSMIPTGMYRATYTCLCEIFELFALQYKERFAKRGLTHNFDNIPNDLHVRIRSEYMSFLIRNIFDNWSKYAATGTVVSINLNPQYKTINRPDSYTLLFTNVVDRVITEKEAESWFSYGERGNATNNKIVEGDGIGLFWIKQILDGRFGIQVFIQTTQINAKRTRLSLCWRLASNWLTTAPELEFGE